MKVYLVITPFFPEHGNFRGPYILDQVRALKKKTNFEIIIFKPVSFLSKKTLDYEYEGFKVYRIKDYTTPSFIYPNKYTDFLSSKSLIEKLKKLNININDIAFCHCHVNENVKFTLLLKKYNPNVKIISQHHGFDIFGKDNGVFSNTQWHNKLCVSYGRSLCRYVDLHIGVSYKTLQFLKEEANDVVKDSYVLYNGVDVNIFKPNVNKTQNKIFIIGCIANFWPLKDHLTLIKAIEILYKKNITNIKVLFIGSGETMPFCKQYIGEHKLTHLFEFINEMMHENLPSFYQSLDLFVLPSYYEAFGCVYAEAYSCGVPFIAVKNQGISEIISEECKEDFLIDKGDEKMLSDLILKQMNSKSSYLPKLTIDLNINSLIQGLINKLNNL